MNNFKVVATLDSDTGVHTLKFEVCVLDHDPEQSDLSRATQRAVEMIRRTQNCPESAIKDLKISRTKD